MVGKKTFGCARKSIGKQNRTILTDKALKGGRTMSTAAAKNASPRTRIRQSAGETIFDYLNVTLLILISLTAILPILHVVAGAFSQTEALVKHQVWVWPVGFTLENIRYVAETPAFWSAGWMT